MIYQINMVMFCSCVKLLESSSMFFEIFKAKSQSADGSLIFIWWSNPKCLWINQCVWWMNHSWWMLGTQKLNMFFLFRIAWNILKSRSEVSEVLFFSEMHQPRLQLSRPQRRCFSPGAGDHDFAAVETLATLHSRGRNGLGNQWKSSLIYGNLWEYNGNLTIMGIWHC